MKNTAHLSPDDLLAELKERVLRQLMDAQTTQSFNGALRADPSKIVISAKDARPSIERLQRYVTAGK